MQSRVALLVRYISTSAIVQEYATYFGVFMIDGDGKWRIMQIIEEIGIDAFLDECHNNVTSILIGGFVQ